MKILKRTLKVLGALFLLVVFVILQGMFGLPTDLIPGLLFGWIEFIATVLRHVTINPLMVAEGIVTLVLIGAGAHFFFARLYQRVHQTESGPAPALSWRWTWSICAIAGFLLLFVSGMAISGVIHHTVWLKTTSEPLRNSSWASTDTKRLMKHVGGQLAKCLENKALPKYPEPVKLYDIPEASRGYDIREDSKCAITPFVHYGGAADPRRRGLSDGWSTPLMYMSDGRSYVLASYGENRIQGGGAGRFDDYIFADGKFITPSEDHN